MWSHYGEAAVSALRCDVLCKIPVDADSAFVAVMERTVTWIKAFLVNQQLGLSAVNANVESEPNSNQHGIFRLRYESHLESLRIHIYAGELQAHDNFRLLQFNDAL